MKNKYCFFYLTKFLM